MNKSADNRFSKAMALLLKHEGGYVNDPRDPGGETKYGISRRSYPSVDVANLTVEAATDIYRLDWWTPNRYGEIADEALSIKVFNIAVNVGARRANLWLQVAAHHCGQDLVLDGDIGPKTLAAVNACDPVRIMTHFLGGALGHYRRLGESKPYYLDGWINRLFDF